MNRLESRPARAALWEYVFYVDVEGHRDDPAVKTALDALAAGPPILKILGSYPQAVY
jgi:chorismate mutase/prephenate dehydratase